MEQKNKVCLKINLIVIVNDNNNKMLKDLVYLCVFYNKKFIDMFSLFLESYVLYGNNNEHTFDLMIMTNLEFKDYIIQLGNKYNVKIIVNVLKSSSIFDSKIARLKIFECNFDISRYRNILYLDTDVLLAGNLKNVLKKDLILEEKLYVVREGDIGNNYHGKFLFERNKSNENVDYKKPGFNSGVLLFKNCDIIKQLFKKIMNGIMEYDDKSQFISQVDQPFFNYYTLTQNLEEMSYLNNLSINNPNGREKHIICHFAGNDSNKYEKMLLMLEKMKI